MARRRKAKAKRKKLSAEEKLRRRTQRKLYRDFRAFMRDLDFTHVKADGVQITVDGRDGELDDIFIFENVLLLTEYTVGKPDASHILKKKPLFDKILADVPRFLNCARSRYPDLPAHLNPIYGYPHYQIRILYVPLQEAAPETIATCPSVVFFQGGLKKYFYALARTIQRSARIEFFSFLDLAWSDVGSGAITASTQSHDYVGQLLPDTMSSFPSGFQVVSFYADPETLMNGAYVLRRDGWRDSTHLYQRILIRSKIGKMRNELLPV